MDKNLLKEYRARWEAVAEIEKQERQNTTVEQRWRKFIGIMRMARELGLKKSENKAELEVVRQRWRKLKGLA
ncbi:MAG: hypothetical protein U0350_15750 [Caldilineaceae bacterium]